MDIDLDFRSDFDPIKVFPDWTRASMVQSGKLMPHPCGVYAQAIPTDPVTRLAAIPYKEAEEISYFKIDFLHVNIYNYFNSRAEIDALLQIDPPWDLLKSPTVVKQLFQISKHFDTIKKVNPQSIEELADVLALIRPGKQWLMDKYLEDKNFARKMLYEKNENGDYSFKRSHSIAYSLVIVLQLHLISAGIEF